MEISIPYVPPTILRQYKKADKVCVVNDTDPDLKAIEIPLPDCPPLHLIDGYGLPAKDQKFRREETPKKLQRLQNEKKHRDGRGYSIEEIWDELSRNKAYYKKEIRFIEKQWYHRLYGYWFFNNGKPTYIDGWHWFYLSAWEIDIGFPKYRSRDRKFYLFARFCYVDPYCYGFNYPKHRREGATYKAQCITYEMTSRSLKMNSGIQSMTEGHAEIVFQKHQVLPWKTVPFYFKPLYQGSTDPKSVMSFSPPALRQGMKGSLAGNQIGLNSSIDFRNAQVKAYDTYKLLVYHMDEAGKTEECDVNERWDIVKECLSQGPIIHGLSIITSTVGEMEKGGGKAFQKLCNASNYYNRTDNKQTTSGLYTLFIPASEGLEGFEDEYGECDTVAATKYIEAQRKALLLENNITGYSTFVRHYPIRYKECFRTSSKDSGFNLQKMESRLEDFRFGNPFKVRGNFTWEKNKVDKEVVFIPDPKGKFYVSLQLNDLESNRKYWDSTFGENGSWVPSNARKFVAGGDTFKFNKTIGNKKSNGGGAVFWKWDPSVDPNEKNSATWKSCRFVCTYSNRPEDKDIYGEDMIMMCVYFGCYMFPEIDVPFLWDYFVSRGYEGFLLHRVNSKTNRLEITPGQTSNTAKQDIFSETMTHIERHVHREVHDELIEEWKDIEGPEDMTRFDLFAASGYSLLGANKTATQYQQEDEEEPETQLFHRTYNYSQLI